MAAVTVASSKSNVEGALRKVYAMLTTPADGDTWNTGLKVIHNVQITKIGGLVDATMDASVASVSGGTVTFQITGTAQDLYVVATGL